MILGLTGPPGSGKDTLADHLVEKYNFKRVAFADPIRAQVKFLLQLKTDNEYNRVKRSNLLMLNHSGRDHLIDGRHLVREIGMLMLSYDKRQFCQYVVDTINGRPDQAAFDGDQSNDYVVTDLRMQHEYDCLKDELKADIIKISIKKSIEDKHITEVGFVDREVDYVIDNSVRDLDTLKLNIDNMMKTRFNVYPSSK